MSKDGWAITNYHVVSSIVFEPEQYVARMVRKPKKENLDMRLVAVDIVHDLALVKLDDTRTSTLSFIEKEPETGTRLYSMGNPHSLGLTVVEGSYSGEIESSLWGNLHLTGAINSGMSGGPTINAEGQVVGVNVASAGNQLGFLVPAAPAKKLFEEGKHSEASDNTFIESVTKQIQEGQDTVIERTFQTSTPTTSLGNYIVMGQSGPAVRCWGDTDKNDEHPYIVTSRFCDMDSSVYVKPDFRSVRIKYGYNWVVNKGLDPMSFSTRYQRQLLRGYGKGKGTSKDLTNYRCQKDFVTLNNIEYLMSYCVRAYKELKGLYDVYVYSATVNQEDRGLITYVYLSGFTLEKGKQITRRILETTRWKN